MKKLTMFFSVLAASLLMSALPAFSGGTGPYGAFGPSDIAGVETQHVAFAGGSGPYGLFGPSADYNIVPGSESQHVAGYVGSGPYGLYGPSGMVSGTESQTQFANKDECLLVAMNCPKEGFTTQQKIDRLNTEISKGTSVYTPDELNMLKGQRDDAYRELNMNKGY